MTASDVEDQFCPECGYNLRGLPGNQCPECGLSLKAGDVSPIPWEHRRAIGRWRAYWRTVLLVTFRPARIARAAGGPVDPSAATRFRLLVIVLAAASALWFYAIFVDFDSNLVGDRWEWQFGAQLVTEIGWNGIQPASELRLIWAVGAGKAPVALIGVVIAAAVACWSPIFSLRAGQPDPVRRERLQYVGAYACAPLAWAPLCATLWQAQIVWARSDHPLLLEAWFLTVFSALAAGALFAMSIAAWVVPVRIAVRATHGGFGRAIAALLAGLPAGVMTGVTVGLGLFPALAGLVIIAVQSLQSQR